MSKLSIDVCVCTACVMNGAMDIMDSIEHLNDLRQGHEDKYNEDVEVEVTTNKCIGECKHSDFSPRVSIDGKTYDKTDSQTVMSQILAITEKGRD